MRLLSVAMLLTVPVNGLTAEGWPHPERNPDSPMMLHGGWVPDNPLQIDFAALPRVPVEHVVVSDVNAMGGVNQHNYLVHYNGRFWAMWSDGPGVEDRVGQVVKYSTSIDGVTWMAPQRPTIARS